MLAAIGRRIEGRAAGVSVLELILGSVVLAALAAPALVRRLGGLGALGLALVPASGFLALLVSGPARVERAWFDGLGVEWSLRHEGLGALFAMLVLGIGSLILAYAARYTQGMEGRDRLIGLLLGFMASMLGLVWAGDAVVLFVFWELTSVTSWLLIGLDGKSAEARRGAQQALLVTGAGGLAMLAGLLGMAHARGSTDLAVLASPGATPDWAVALVLVGCFAKSAQFPMHFWLPNAMSAPTPVSAYLHSATMVKAGVYLLAILAPALPLWAMSVLVGFGMATLVAGCLFAIGQRDLKRILAYTTVASLGTLVALIGFGEAARLAFVLFLVSHALYKAAGFMLAGAIDHGAGSRDVHELGGLAASMRFTMAVALLSGMAAVGVGPTLGSLAKGAMGKVFSEPWLHGANLLFTVVGAMVATLIGVSVFVGKPAKEAHDDPPLALPILVLAFASPALALGAGDWTARFGFPALPPGKGFDLASFVLLAVGVALGLSFRKIQESVGKVWAQVPLVADRIYDGTVKSLFSVAGATARFFEHGLLRHDLATVFAVAALLSAVTFGFRHDGGVRWNFGDAKFIEVSIAILAAVAAVRAVFVSGRLTAVILLGIVGFSIAAVYLLNGAPDLVLTQFLVETLTVVLFVLVFRTLPKFKKLSTPGSRIRDGVVALGFGGFMAALVMEVVATPKPRPASDFYALASVPEAKGRNVVNTVLVDFRALDTLGEITVVGLAALGIYAMLHLVVKGGVHLTVPVAKDDRRSLLLATATRFVVPVLILFAAYLFWRGHDEPGGGFIAGLVVSGAFALYAVAHGAEAVRDALHVSPRLILAIGLVVAFASGLVGMVGGRPFLSGEWTVLGGVKLGTPVLFDLGVLLVVVGAVAAFLMELSEGEVRPV